MELSDVKAKIYFYLRERLYNSMLVVCNDALKKFIGEISLNLYHALALHQCNRHLESIRELEALRSENDIRLATTIALIYAHRATGVTDKEALANLESSSREAKRNATPNDFINTAFVFYCYEKYEKALDYVERALKTTSDNIEAYALKGWILMKCIEPNYVDALKIFENCMKDTKRLLDISIGLSEAHLLNKNSEEALNTINKAIVRFPSTNIPLVVKLKILFSLQDYDQCLDIINRILNSDNRNYTAYKINILILLCRDGKYEQAGSNIAKLSDILETLEPKNATVFYENGMLFSRLSGRSLTVLSECYKLVEKALYLDSMNIDYLIEMGYQCLLQGKCKEANKYYKSASKSDNTSFNALLGLTLCDLTENGRSDQIKQQIFFLLELQEGAPTPMLSFMRAKLADNIESKIQFLEETCSEQLKPTLALPFSDIYLQQLDPDFLLDVVKTYFNYAPISSSILAKQTAAAQQPNNVMTNSLNTLKIITKACPGLEEAQFLLARVLYMKGDYLNAMKTLTHIVTELNSTSSDAHLLIAQIHLNNSLYERASQSLEVGLSHNFKVRENPLYHLLLGLIEKRRGNLDEAIKCFTLALSLIGVDVYKKQNQQQHNLTYSDKATIYIELISAHREANQVHEATKLMEDAMEEFHNTPEEARIMILSAEHAASTNNVTRAIEMLSKVNPNESYYLTAKTKLAEVFLQHRRDKQAYLGCYHEMVQFNPSSESFLLLGDAYMKILEPDKALDSYNSALQMNPTDPYLMSKMGKALIDTHYFKRAVVYYKDSIAVTGNQDLKLQLADLYMQLKEYDKAEMLLVSEIDAEKGKKNDDLFSLQYRTKLYKLLADVTERAGNVKAAAEVLKNARDNQNRVRKILSVEQNLVPEEEVECLVNLNMKLADLSSFLRDNERAIGYYKDALSVSPNNVKILAALAKLYMQFNHLELCQQTCANLLNLDPDNEIASVLMADIAFRKIDFDMSVFHFTQLVTKQPTNWNALVRLVEVLRRTGNLDDVPQYLKQAEQFCDNPTREPGYSYCVALYQWYTGNLNSALRNFNNARQDTEWGQDALINMIEICLNPDDELFGDQLVDNDDYEYRDARSMALKTAERLLKELRQKANTLGEDSLKCRLLANFLLLASKEKYHIERALEDFINIASQDIYKDSIGPILGVATAYTLLKQGQRAKTQLKRIIKNVWTFEDAEYLERCWLLLADYYIQASKYDLAMDLLRRVLQHNKACSKAYEFTGFVCEKEQKYRDAATHYEAAWKYGGRNNPAVGYKLAYNLMKCKKYADAIDVGQQVMKNHPDYTKIKKDILDKSINNLRT